MSADLIVNFVPTGMVPEKAQNSALPITPSEIAGDVRHACAIGINMVHLHARDHDGSPTLSPSRYGETIARIREFAPDLVLCVSLSGRRTPDVGQRMEPLDLAGDLQPDMASLTLSSLNFASQASCNSPETVRALAAGMQDRGILPELEIFDLGMVNYARYLGDKHLLPAICYANVILGNIASAQATLLDAGAIRAAMPPAWLWAFGGIGKHQLAANALAAACGGGMRVGLEDNLFLDPARTVPATNAKLLERAAVLARIHGREVMPPAELRKRLGLNPGHGIYGLASPPGPGETSAR